MSPARGGGARGGEGTRSGAAPARGWAAGAGAGGPALRRARDSFSRFLKWQRFHFICPCTWTHSGWLLAGYALQMCLGEQRSLLARCNICSLMQAPGCFFDRFRGFQHNFMVLGAFSPAFSLLWPSTVPQGAACLFGGADIFLPACLSQEASFTEFHASSRTVCM
jgi:hypothetical protein